MYFIVAVALAIVSAVLWYFFRNRKGLHLDVLALIFTAASLMWLVDCIFSAANGEGFITFDDPIDGWIALSTALSGVFLWLVVSFVLNNNKKVEAK